MLTTTYDCAGAHHIIPLVSDVLFGKHLPGVVDHDWAQVLQGHRLVSCPPTATLVEAMQAMDTAAVHRCYVVDGQGKPVSVVAISDVLRRVIA